MSDVKPIYRTDGEWVAFVCQGNLFDLQGEWIGWLDGQDVYLPDGEYAGYIGQDGRLLRKRVLPYRQRRRPPTEHPHCHAPALVPLAPLFAELSYDLIDVFEEMPDIFAMIHELRPDAGERQLHRLVDVNPELAAQQKVHKVKQELLEEMAYGLVDSYGVTQPPVPIEAMSAGQPPAQSDWIQTASPAERLRLAEELVERLGHSNWSLVRGYCGPGGFSAGQVQYAARAILMPRHWIRKIPETLQQPSVLAHRYVVSVEAATLRLHDLE